MARWEYNTVIFEANLWLASGELDGEAFQAKLDELGKKGWELVSVFDTNRQEGVTFQVVAVFKRSLA
ncbi:MAG: DUF4177 domain-containing protein [Lacunisphaera sp.]|nr:DUF4177 domain-containing protein [Lacunisphaera sp.]